MKWNKLIGFGVVVGCLVAGCTCLAYAGDPGVEERPLREVRVEGPENYGPLPKLLEGETLSPEPLPQGMDSWEVSSPSGPPTGMDAATLREWSKYQIELRRLELDRQREAHRQQMDRERMEMQRERDQQRYQYQQMRTSSRYNQYGYTGAGYAGNNYYPSYTPQAPLYTQPAPMYVPVATPAYNPYISVGLGYGGCDHGSCDYRSSRRRSYGYGSYYGERRGGHHHCH